MQSEEPLLYPEDVYDLASKPQFHNSTFREIGFGSIDDFVEQTFRKIPQKAIQKYAIPQIGNGNNGHLAGISEEEQRKLFAFYVCLMLEGHEGMERDNGKPYAVHPLGATFFQADYGVSSFSLNSTLAHDLGEEWMKKIGVTEKQEDYRHIKTAVLLTPGILAYEYARAAFSNPERFYPHINMIQMVYNSLTRWPDETYFNNLHDTFYRQEKNHQFGIRNRKMDLLDAKRMRKAREYLSSLFGINSEDLIRDFQRDIIMDYNPGKQGWKKIRRRAIMGKVADGYDNSSDLLEQEVTKSMKILSKEIFTINQIMIMKGLMRKPESVEELNRLLDETQGLKRVLFGSTGVIAHLVRKLEKTGGIPNSYIDNINSELREYVSSPLIGMRTSPADDRSPFSNILNTCVSVLLGYDETIVKENDMLNQWKYVRVFQEVGRKFFEDDRFIIRRFDLRQLYKEKKASGRKKGAGKRKTIEGGQ